MTEELRIACVVSGQRVDLLVDPELRVGQLLMLALKETNHKDT